MRWLKRRKKGYTSLSLSPLKAEHRKIRLNARQCEIHRVTVNGETAHFTYTDHQRDVPLQHTQQLLQDGSIHDHAEFSRMWEAMAEDANEGELCVDLPESVHPTSVLSHFFFFFHLFYQC